MPILHLKQIFHMTIKTFIQQKILLERLHKAEILVVYDKDSLYRSLCNELGNEHTLIVDATESSIESREAAMAGLQKLGKQSSKLTAMLVYVPTAAPVNDEQRQKDPFSVYVAVGDYFPKSAGDEYQSLCLRFKSDDTTEVRRVFAANPKPEFSVIDAIGTVGGCVADGGQGAFPAQPGTEADDPVKETGQDCSGAVAVSAVQRVCV